MRNIYKGVVAAGLLWTATVNVNGQQRGVIENVFVDVNSYNDSEYAVPAHLIGGMVTEGSVYGTFDSTEEYEFVTLNGETEPSPFLVSSYMNQYITDLDMEEIRNYININGQVMLMWDGSNRQYSINFISRGNLPKPAAFCPEMQIIINHNIYLTSDESNAYALPKVVFPRSEERRVGTEC